MTYTMSMSYKSARMELVVWEDESTGSVSSLWSDYRGRGHATGLFERVIHLADALKLNLILEVAPYGDESSALDKDQLIRFYKKFGFEETDGTTIMERKIR